MPATKNPQDSTGQPQATVDTATTPAFPGTDDARTVDQVSAQIKTDNAAEERHPAHGVLDALENEINALGGFVVSKLKPLVDQIRGLL